MLQTDTDKPTTADYKAVLLAIANLSEAAWLALPGDMQRWYDAQCAIIAGKPA